MRNWVLFISVTLCLGVLFGLRGGAVSLQISLPDVSFVPVAREAIAFTTSPPVRTFVPFRKGSHAGKRSVREVGNIQPNRFIDTTVKRDSDAALAASPLAAMPSPSLTFDGLTNYDNIAAYNAVIMPPDTIGDVGPNHYVQAVNALVRVFDKAGNTLTPPFKMSQLFAPLGTTCSTFDSGEPVVLYDPLADRWLLSQYCYNTPPFRQMIAVSKTGDPTGAYFVYEFVMPNIRINDVSKFGVWPDGYYMSDEEFTGSDYSGSGIFAFDRAKMLAGDPTASYIYFNRPSATTVRRGNLLPADLDGLRPPAPGAPNIFVGYSATEYGDAQDAIRLFDFHADFSDPTNSTFTERPESPLPVAAFDPTSPDGRADIAQPPPGDFLDANSDRLNYRVAYRNFGASESLVFNQTVRTSPTVYRAGVRVYELRRTGGNFAVVEQTTIGDADSSRWIASMAQDHQGNLAVGYNLVTDDKQPSLVYSGKLAGEPAGTFRSPATLADGTGVQKAFGYRWGDYSGMSVDPSDDCTFWMTGEYYTLESQNFSDFTWLTRIGKFRFPECTAAPRSSISGAVTNATNGQPIVNAQVTTSVYSRITSAAGSYGPLTLLPGSYTLTATAFGFSTQSITVSSPEGQTITQNFVLQPVAVPASTGMQVVAESCATGGSADPGETLSMSLSLQNTGALNAADLAVTLLATDGITSSGPAQNYGSLPAGGSPVTRTFSFTVSPGVTCGGVVTLSFQMNDGGANLGILPVPLQTGKPKVAFQQNFDRGQLAQLPPRWVRDGTSVIDNIEQVDRGRYWRPSTARAHSGQRSAFSPDPYQIGQNSMATPVFLISTPNARLTFQNWYKLETTFLRNRRYDGSVLEIKIGIGDWQDILAAGGTFETGGYDGIIDSCCHNPLGGRQGWSGRSGLEDEPIFVPVRVRLPASTAGQQVQLRWRLGTDIGNGIVTEGQYIDDVLVTDGFVCGCP